MFVEFGEYLPDQPTITNSMVVANNVLPNAKGYKPFPSATQVSDAVDARARGAFAAKADDGAVYSYVGTGTKLHELDNMTHSDITNVGGDYTLASEHSWKFAKFGNRVIAVAPTENPQSISLGGANFADLAGSPPKAKNIAIINNFLVLGNLENDPNKVRWSAINNPESWTIDADTQADEQELISDSTYGGGAVRGITSGDIAGNIFQEFTIWRMQYVGSPLIFDIKEILPNYGLGYENSLTQEGRLVHFIGNDGFYQLIDGTQIRPIGENKVNAYFLNRVQETSRHRVVGASDPLSQKVFWIYPSTASVDGTPDSIIVYDWANDKWSTAQDSLDWIYAAPREGYNLDDLDSFAANLDALTPNLDADTWKSRGVALSAYDETFKKVIFTGSSLPATLTTGEVQLYENSRAHVKSVTPLVDMPSYDGATNRVRVAVSTRDIQQESKIFSTAQDIHTRTGKANFREDGRYHSMSVTTEGEWSTALGVNVETVKSGVQ